MPGAICVPCATNDKVFIARRQNPILEPTLLDHSLTKCTGYVLRKQKLKQNFGCRMYIRDKTLNRKGKGSRIRQKEKLNCDADAT